MWMLLEADHAEMPGAGRRGRGLGTTESKAARQEPPVEVPAELTEEIPAGSLDSREPSPAIIGGSREVSVYLHPGRIKVGKLDLRAAAEQFSLSSASVYADMDQAEAANRGRSGFLLDISEACSGPDGSAIEPGVRFAERLR